jgi:hypothetical protein
MAAGTGSKTWDGKGVGSHCHGGIMRQEIVSRESKQMLIL